ncbi:flavocytochrome c [Butyrivibrio sp. YAB3001]|uniref:flavocytochrome c n=1 Tax=Butyrivibrio sp. YAB3001 TaxID=1520812 RepID=UPI0008F6483B|nr:flavocytochrome c [Butyrivibrio sp. YAB3001]SFB66488.1 fumarate reductase flavoprotein subunit [Butyrivibrio sp. YAB3001]
MNDLKKRIISCVLCVLLVLLCIWGSTYVVQHEGHMYEGNAKGFGGNIAVSVYVEGDTITDITYQTENETPSVGIQAIRVLKTKILKTQNTKIDAISGATYTSRGFLEAVDMALAQAGIVADGSNKGNFVAEDVEETADVVVVGGGGAGMTAAITAAENGKKVILLEKNFILGGNTSIASSGMNAAETHYQAEQGIEDTVDSFVEDTMKGGKELNDRDLVRTLAENSASAIDWLDRQNAPLNGPIGRSGGQTNKRTHRPVDAEGNVTSVGNYLVTALSGRLDELGIEVILGATVNKIIMENGKATGVTALGDDGNNITIHANGVVVATGGFGGNMDKVVELRPDLAGYISTNVPTATGDAIDFLTEVNADFVDMEQIQLHPTVIPSDGTLVGEAVRGDGAILVNREGKRFTSETSTRDAVSAAEIAQTGGNVWLIANEYMHENSAVIQKLDKGGYLIKADTLKDLAKAMDFDDAATAAFEETVANWVSYVANGEDKEFGRDIGVLTDLSEGPYYAVNVGPGIHHCMGGVKINTEAQVISKDGTPIPGLFACGEVTGGVHGGNRLGGNAIADIVVFGRIAGENASK